MRAYRLMSRARLCSGARERRCPPAASKRVTGRSTDPGRSALDGAAQLEIGGVGGAVRPPPRRGEAADAAFPSHRRGSVTSAGRAQCPAPTTSKLASSSATVKAYAKTLEHFVRSFGEVPGKLTSLKRQFCSASGVCGKSELTRRIPYLRRRNESTGASQNVTCDHIKIACFQ